MKKAFRIVRRPQVVVPLYIYPAPGSWEPLLQAVRDNPSVSFIAIINPHNGPGAGPLPDANYRVALSQLSVFPNLQRLGYVHCTYGERNIADIQHDIQIYSAWNSQLRLDGIFFDETPSAQEAVGLMRDISNFTRSSWKTATGHSAFIVHNPGVTICQEFYQDADLVVTFEQSADHWESHFLQHGVTERPIYFRAKDVAIVHSCGDDVEGLAFQIMELGFGGLYLTEQVGGRYNRWPDSWTTVLGILKRIRDT
jgi:hypothetical protein